MLEFCCVAMKKSIKREKTKPSAALDLFCDLPSHFKRFLNFSDVRSFLSLTVKKGHTSLKRNVQGLNWLAENHAKTLDAVHTANDLESRVRQTPDSSSLFP